jgi:hypothetical protein
VTVGAAPLIRSHVYRPYGGKKLRQLGPVCAFNDTCRLSRAAHARAVREGGRRIGRPASA